MTDDHEQRRSGAQELLGSDGESLPEWGALLAVLRQAPVAISLFALPERRYKFVNVAHIAMIGRDLTGLTLEDAYPEMPERERQQHRENQDRIVAGGTPVELSEVALSTPSGTRFFDVSAALWVDNNGRKRGIISVSTDVTDKVRAREVLDASERRLYELFMQAPAAICVLRGAELVYEMANSLYLKVAGRDANIIGKPLLEAIPEARGQGFDDILHGVMSSGEVFIGKQMPLKIDRRGDGKLEDTWWTFTCAPLRNSHGVIDRVMALVHDVTEQVLASNEREGHIEELQRAVRFSELFVGILGHDLRNPLSAIMTAANLLETRADSERIITPVRRIVASAERMARMVSQLLEFSRIRLGPGISVELTAVDLAEVSRSVIEEMESAQARQIQLESVGDVAGTWDRDRLCQVVSTLANNACQHGTPGSPVLIRLDGTKPDGVRLEVRNRGTIPPDVLPTVFEPLAQIESAPLKRRGSSGLGLGLYITHQIAIAHSGTIRMESNEEDGTRVVVELPRHGRKDKSAIGGGEAPMIRGPS